MIRTKLIRAATTAAIAVPALLAPQASALGEKQTTAEQTAASTAGVVARGSLGGTEFGPGRAAHYDVVLTVPAGVVTGSGPLDPRSADLRRTWIAFDELDGATGEGLCHAYANPAGLTKSYDGAWSFHAAFDVSCPDDRRYRSYRVYVDTDARSWAHWDWQSNFETHSGFAGDGTLGSARVIDTYGTFSRTSYGFLRVCGYDGRAYRCFDDGISAATTSATNPRHTLDVFFTDGVTALERPY